MKPILILGLALASNAIASEQEDNELRVAPVDQFGYPKHYPRNIMFDDELYKGNLPREAFKTEEDYRRYIVKRSEEADDEFLIRPFIPHVSADDELLYLPFLPKDKFKTEEDWKKYLDKTSRSRFEHPTFPKMPFKNEEERRKYMLAIADDELRVLSKDQFETPEEYKRYLDSLPRCYVGRPNHKKDSPKPVKLADDEELFFAAGQRLGSLVKGNPTIMFDEVADDELSVRLLYNEYQKYRPLFHKIFSDDAADDELAVRSHIEQHHRVQNRGPIFSKFDEQADDELAYLGHLINERTQHQSVDEFKKAEKPYHGKTKERTQMKRKLRPIADEAPLAQN